MRVPGKNVPRARRGMATVLAMVFLALMAALGVAYASLTALSHQQARNQSCAQAARMEAESGLAVLLKFMEDLRLPGNTTQATFAGNLCSALGDVLNGTGNLAGQSVTASGDAVCVPDISTSGGSFRSWIRWSDANHCRLEVKGTAGSLSARVAMDLAFTPRQPRVFDYGLASRGQMRVGGNAKIVGVNQGSEGSVLSATEAGSEAICVGDSATISGDLYAACDSTVAISGNPSVGGVQGAENIARHVHLGQPAPDFPQVDVAPLTALATNVTSSYSGGQSTLVLNNIRIPANTNPTFSGNVVLNGVVYVEAPNIVKFEGRTTLNGLVVTQDSGQPLDQCQLTFSGHVEARGVENLPDTPEFAAVKQQQGTFVLAPGFGVTFSGSFSAVNGSIAADQLTFTGSAEGVVRGSVIGLKDLPTSVGGSVEIYVDAKNAYPNPAGFVKSLALVSDPSSYTELRGGE